MPRTKHHKKNMSDKKWRKRKNIRAMLKKVWKARERENEENN